MRPLVTGSLFLLIAALPYVGMLWRSSSEPATPSAAPAERLTLLSPHRREVRQEYARAFRDWLNRHQGRDVEVVWLDVGGTSKMMKEVESRFQANPDSCGVDLMFGGGIDPFLAAARRDWLAPIEPPPPSAAGLPATVAGSPVYDPAGLWYGVALSGFGILYNRPLIERLGLPEPLDWEDLGRPAYYSWVGSGDPRSSGSVHMCYEIILQAYGFEAGWNLIARLCANVRTFGESGGTVPREVAAGDIAAGMVIEQYGQTVIAAVGGNRLAMVLPARHTLVNADAIALFKGAPQPELAALFVEYALSPEGQRLLFQPAGVNGQRRTLHRMPIRPELYADPHAPAVKPYNMPAALMYDNDKGSRRWNIFNDLAGVWLIDAHGGLRAAWARVIARGARPDEVARLCAPPVTEAELDRLAGLWGDSRLRQTVMRRWAQEADARYQEILSLPQPEPAP